MSSSEFWELIDEVETASLLLGREDCTENQRRRKAARRKLEEWLKAREPEGLQLTTGSQSLGGVPVYVGVADLQGGVLSFTAVEHLVEYEVGEDAFVGAILTKGEDGRLRLRRGAEYSCGVAGAAMAAGQRARLDLSRPHATWMPVEL